MQDSLSVTLLVGAWAAALALGFNPLFSYDLTPGRTAKNSCQWPAGSQLQSNKKLTLLMFLHPKCPCSKASLNQLSRLSGLVGHGVRALVVFEQPAAMDESWSQSPLWEQAKSIPGVTVIIDKDQREAKRFGVNTSGETLVYSADGALLFQGGITGGRGHEGDCPSFDKVVEIFATGKTAKVTHADSFGCALFDG